MVAQYKGIFTVHNVFLSTVQRRPILYPSVNRINKRNRNVVIMIVKLLNKGFHGVQALNCLNA